MESGKEYMEQREQYERLLFRRDAVEKEALEYELSYIAEFGELLTERFRLKISCIEKKKIIAYCQTAVNRGQRVDVEEMNAYIGAQMAEYNEQLEEMIQTNRMCNEATPISQSDFLMVKRMYRKIAKKIHPDLHPEYEEIPELAELWESVMAAYKCNDLCALERLDIQTDSILREHGKEVEDDFIPGLEEKISALEAEIETITSTDPYLYKLILDDREQIDELKEQLLGEIEEYKDYETKLAEVIKSLIEGGAQFTWEN